jgi:hypothetical protein
MQAIFVFIIILVLVSVSSAVLPSDQIVTAPLPSTKSLSGTTVGSITEIKKTHEPLGMWKSVEIPNMGHYASWAITIEQGSESFVGVPSSSMNFFKQNVSPNVTNSVGSNKPSEYRPIRTPRPSKYGEPSEYNGTLVYGWNNTTST